MVEEDVTPTRFFGTGGITRQFHAPGGEMFSRYSWKVYYFRERFGGRSGNFHPSIRHFPGGSEGCVIEDHGPPPDING